MAHSDRKEPIVTGLEEVAPLGGVHDQTPLNHIEGLLPGVDRGLDMPTGFEMSHGESHLRRPASLIDHVIAAISDAAPVELGRGFESEFIRLPDDVDRHLSGRFSQVDSYGAQVVLGHA
jgi:hypothetical protein